MLGRSSFCLLFNVGCLVLVTIFLIFFGGSRIIHNRIATFLTLSPNATRFADWKEIKGDQRIQFWFWEVTNPSEVRKGHKPALREIGPISYNIKRKKENIVWTNKSVDYVENYWFFYDHNRSAIDENQKVTVFNFAMLSIFLQLDQESVYTQILKNAIELAISIHKYDAMFTTRTVHELLFGYFDPLLSLINDLSLNATLFDPRIGLFKGLNGTHRGTFTVLTDGFSDIQKIIAYNGKPRMGIYDDDQYCDQINGTDGTFFNLNGKVFDELQVFSLDLCRSLKLSFARMKRTRLGKRTIRTALYELSKKTMQNSSINPANKCFDRFGSAMFDVSKCAQKLSGSYFAFPVVFSNPHFHSAHAKHYSRFDGLSPHQRLLTKLEIEPNTGFPMKANVLAQINFYRNLVNGSVDLSGFLPPDQVYPIVWLNQSYLGTEDYGRLLKKNVQLIVDLMDYLCLAVGSLAVFAIVSGAIGWIALSAGRQQTGFEDITGDDDDEVSRVASPADEHTPLLHSDLS